ncbi:MAG: PAS domain S-box protein [Thermodesulfobacteriota bacterium]|nr:MAG: PAS domain S-box protein [Thermodesulfobacteriota bacterium]
MVNRDSGIDFIGQVPWGTHLCQFYGTENDHMDMAVPFIAAGLKSNERCVFIASGREQQERALKALERAVPELEKRISGRELEFQGHEWYCKDGSFEPEEVIRSWTEMHDRALKAGFEGLRVVGNTLWLEKKLWKSFMEYEEAVSGVIRKLNMLALCTYPVGACGAAELLEAAASHKPAIIKCNGQWRSIEGLGHKASESALKESERRYRLLTEFTSDIVFRMSIRPDGGLDLEWITEAFENVSGYGNWEISSSESLEKLIHPEDAREYRDMLASVLSGRQSDSEVRYISRASEVRWLKLYALPEYYEGTRIIKGVIGRGKDITRRKRAEERLRDSERKHRGLFESISEGILETSLDGAVIDCNQACLDMLGYSRDELKTLSISGIAGPPKGGASDESPSGEREYEYECRRKDGSTVPVCQRTMPIRDASGAVVGAWLVLKDLSPLKEACRELDARVEEGTRELRELVSIHRAGEERFRALVETTSDWVWETDPEGAYTYVSPKVLELLGYRPEEVAGRNRFDFMAPDEAQCMRAAFSEIAAVRKPFSLVEIRKTRKDGRMVIIETSGAPILDPNGSLLGYRGVDRDITARKVEEEERGRIQDQLIQSQKMEAIGALAGGIAHDFNNLMVVIKLNAELALKREQQKGDISAFLEQIGIASERAENLTRQLLIFSRKQPTQTRALNLNAKVDNMLRILKRLIGENIRIKTFFDPGIKKIRADKVNIEQIVMNLVINARDALPRGGTITIRTDNVEVSGSDSARTASLSAGAYARLTVEDDGVGIEGGVIRRIFEPFFTTKGPRGTGLGLAVVHGIVKELKGWIDVESKSGAGARFEVYLPAMEWIEEAEAKRPPEGPLLGKGERVLVVEDEKLLRKSVAVVLARNGYRVFEASSAKEAIELFEKEKGIFDLVFSDMVLEDKDGVRLVDDLRARNSAFKALITSGYLNVESQWPAIRDRGFNFLQKPYEVTDLLRSIRNAIEN